MTQLDMFSTGDREAIKERVRLLKYWHESLHDCAADLVRYRKQKFTTGWSFASFAMWGFAKNLFRAGELSQEHLKHYSRVERWARRETRREDRYLASQHSERVKH